MNEQKPEQLPAVPAKPNDTAPAAASTGAAKSEGNRQASWEAILDRQAAPDLPDHTGEKGGRTGNLAERPPEPKKQG